MAYSDFTLETAVETFDLEIVDTGLLPKAQSGCSFNWKSRNSA